MTTTSTAPEAREILLMFAAEGEPTPKRLEAYAKDHPELRRELTELAVEMVLEPSRPLPAADASTKRIVSSALDRFRAKSELKSPATIAGAGAPTDVFERFVGLAFPQLAARLELSPVFLIKLQDGLIEAVGFPRALIKSIAEEVGHGVEAIQALLDQPAAIPTGTMAKADGKPEAGSKQSFEEAVATSGLTPEQQKRLLEMAKAERGSD